MERYFGYAIDAAGTLETAPDCTVAVYNAGTLTLATIYEDEVATPKANPFNPDSYAYFHFYAAAGRYDVRFSGTGITTAFTWSDIQLVDTYNLARTDLGNTFLGNQSISGNLTVSGSGTFGGNALITSAGKIPALTSTYFASLDGSTLTGLSATQVTAGTLPSAQLSGTYSEALTLSNAGNTLSGATLALGATPATTGSLRLTYNEGIYSKNSSAVDTLLLKLGTSDKLELSDIVTEDLVGAADDTYNIGETATRYRNGHIKDLYSSMLAFGYSFVAAGGAVRLGNDSTYAIGFRNAADSGDKYFYLNASDQFYFDTAVRVSGNILPHTDDALDLGTASLQWRNLELSGTASLNAVKVAGGIQFQLSGGSYAEMLDINGSNELVLGHASYGIKLNQATVAAGSSAIALGNVPNAAVGTFHGWIPFKSSTGIQIWIPAWE